MRKMSVFDTTRTPWKVFWRKIVDLVLEPKAQKDCLEVARDLLNNLRAAGVPLLGSE